MRTLQRRFALIRRYVLGVLLLVPLFFAQGAQPQAAMVQLNGVGRATDITDLLVDGQHVNIHFEFGPHSDIFGITNGVFLNADLFVAAIDEALNDAGTPLIEPTGFAAGFSAFLVPGPLGGGGAPTLTAQQGFCTFSAATGACSPMSYTPSAPLLLFPVGTSANWAVPSPVPLPAALPLFGSALAMLGMVGWRRRRQAAA